MIKKIFFLCLITAAMGFLSGSSHAQTLQFCEGVSNDGYAITPSNHFYIQPGGGYLYVLVNLPYDVDCTSVRYEIYLDNKYNSTINQEVQTNWQWFWEKITFTTPGIYTVYCVDCNDIAVPIGKVKIEIQ